MTKVVNLISSHECAGVAIGVACLGVIVQALLITSRFIVLYIAGEANLIMKVFFLTVSNTYKIRLLFQWCAFLID